MNKYDGNLNANITQHYEGWEIRINGRTFHYNHEDPDYGALQLAKMLRMLGFRVSLTEES